MKSNIFLLISLVVLLSASESTAALVANLMAFMKTPPKPEDYSNLQCTRTCYRSLNGSCNNVKYPHWGAAGSRFSRMFGAYSYSDGNCAMPCSANPRQISLNFVQNDRAVDCDHTLLMPMFGQYLAHDTAFASGGPQTGAQAVTCNCINGKLSKLPPTSDRCVPIKIPKWDPYCTPEGVQCYDFVRTLSTCDQYKDRPGEQFNAVTSFIDHSPLYGTSDEEANDLRTFKNGMLKYVIIDGRMYPPKADPRTCNLKGATKPLCISTGDTRANQNPHIAIAQIVFLRMHNDIAKSLSVINPCWCDEQIYQEARNIMIAVEQHIAFDEYFTTLVGKNTMIKHGINDRHPNRYCNGYNENVDPSTLNEFTTAAFRTFHRNVAGHFLLIDETCKQHGVVSLSHTFNNMSLLVDCQTEKWLAIGAASQKQMDSDRYHVQAITLQMFADKGQLVGQDLMAFDIHRGRDHGLADYPTAVKECGLGNPKTFDDLKFISPQDRKMLKRYYKSIHDIDLRVGLTLEKLKPNTLTGPTTACIIVEQAYRFKVGDYYFYRHKHKDYTHFTVDQLKEICSMTFAKVICQYAGNFPIQPRGFEMPSCKNKVVPCCELPFLDLTKWKVNCSGK